MKERDENTPASTLLLAGLAPRSHGETEDEGSNGRLLGDATTHATAGALGKEYMATNSHEELSVPLSANSISDIDDVVQACRERAAALNQHAV